MLRLVAQLFGLERRTARGGRDVIDHGIGGHDDVVNAAAGALLGVTSHRRCATPGCPDATCGGLHFFELGGSTWDTGAPVGMTRAEYDKLKAESAEGAPAPAEGPAPVPPTDEPEPEGVSDLTRWNRRRRERRGLDVW